MVDGKYFVIDAHCHIYPDRIAQKAERATENFYHFNGFGDGTVGMLLREGKKAGIDRFIVQSVATTPHQVSGINRFIADTVRNGGVFAGLGTLHPDSEDLKRDVDEIARANRRAFGKRRLDFVILGVFSANNLRVAVGVFNDDLRDGSDERLRELLALFARYLNEARGAFFFHLGRNLIRQVGGDGARARAEAKDVNF